uniref:Autotransporter outer membrane beta-barrel domain-containing protein n=1 Tax=Haemonchus contortus TaxID=6289 RepID=A0A7I4YJG0_HAECO
MNAAILPIVLLFTAQIHAQEVELVQVPVPVPVPSPVAVPVPTLSLAAEPGSGSVAVSSSVSSSSVSSSASSPAMGAVPSPELIALPPEPILAMTPGGSGPVITTKDGNTLVTATIGGKRYTAQFPGETNSISTSSSMEDVNGRSASVFTITVNGKTYIYKTVDGNTTATDGQGNTLSNGGPFGVISG